MKSGLPEDQKADAFDFDENLLDVENTDPDDDALYSIPVRDEDAEDNQEIDPLDAEIFAYLDGELGREEKVSFEKKIEDDPELRRQVEQERDAWNALGFLEELPSEKDDYALLETTVEKLDAETKAELQKVRTEIRKKKSLFLGLEIVGALILLFVGYAAFAALVPNERAKRERDATAVERLVQLETIGDFEFLSELAATGVFQKRRAESPEPHSARLEKRPYDVLEKDRGFIRLQRRFEALEPEKQDEWRKLSRKIDAASNAEELERVLNEYSYWFVSSLSVVEREALLTLPREERIEEIKRRLQNTSNLPGEELRAKLPEQLRKENFAPVYWQFIQFAQQNVAPEKRGAPGELEFVAFVNAGPENRILDVLPEDAKEYLRGLNDQERRERLADIVAVSVAESQRESAPRPGAGNPGGDQNRSGNSLHELAETLREVPDDVREKIASLPQQEAYRWLTFHNFARSRNQAWNQIPAGQNINPGQNQNPRRGPNQNPDRMNPGAPPRQNKPPQRGGQPPETRRTGGDRSGNDR